ncbi:MAG: carboxypeptidase-like regulatory domain-containing protein, partial [Saprospiraceae bacterium]
MKQLLFTLLMLLCGTGFLSAQRTISGTVTDEAGVPVIGANIILKESPTIGTITDIDGRFALHVSSGGTTLVISYAGFSTKEVVLTSESNYSIVIAEGQLLDEVVLIAYGSARKEALTGSVTTIKSTDIATRAINNITNAIEGSSPGVVVSTANGQPGSALDIRIRGFGSINATQSPL